MGKRDKFVESEIALWVEAVLDDCIPPKPFDELLKDGVLLCRVMNVLQPNSIPKIQKPFTKEKQIENVNAFLNAAKSYGVAEDKLFKVSILFILLGLHILVSYQFTYESYRSRI
jgi:hypothetical protein